MSSLVEPLQGQGLPPTTGDAQSAVGGQLAARMATISDVDPVNYCYTLKDDGDNLIKGAMPMGDSGGARGEGDIRIYDVGTRVVLFEVEVGRDFFIPVDEANSDPVPYEIDDAENILDTGVSLPSSREDTDITHAGTRPRDLQEGDRVLRGFMGNMVAILSNGITIIRGSRTSELLMSALDGTVRMVSHKFLHYIPTWGKITIGENAGGGASLQVRASGDRSYRGDGTHKIAVDIGPGVRVEIRTGDGTPAGFIEIDSQGGINLSSKPSVITQESRERQDRVTGDSTERVDGQVTQLRGKVVKRTDSSNEIVATNKKISAESQDHSATKQFTTSAGTRSDSVVPPALTPQSPQDVAYDVTVEGNYSIKIGKGLTGASAMPSLIVDAFNNISLLAQSGGIQLLSASPATSPSKAGLPGIVGTPADPNGNADPTVKGVILGSPNPAKAFVPPVKWDMTWDAYLTALHKALDLHTHLYQLPLLPVPGPPAGITLPANSSPPTLALHTVATSAQVAMKNFQTMGAGVLVN